MTHWRTGAPVTIWAWQNTAPALSPAIVILAYRLLLALPPTLGPGESRDCVHRAYRITTKPGDVPLNIF